MEKKSNVPLSLLIIPVICKTPQNKIFSHLFFSLQRNFALLSSIMKIKKREFN